MAGGSSSTVPGGVGNHARGRYSFAAGFYARAAHDASFVWSDDIRGFADSLISTAPAQFLIRATGGVGIGTDAPRAQLHVQGNAQNLLTTATASEEIVVLSTDSVVGLYSDGGGTWGSVLALGEVSGAGSLVNKWSIARRTGTSGSLDFTFGTSADYSLNNTLMRIDTDGSVHADGSFTGGGADLAEYFPLAASGSTASVRPGDLVGLRGGQVSLDTEAAEQVMIASSDPAFVGNPDAEAGGALVALVGQAEVRLAGAANVGDLLVASGHDDGTARAVAPEAYHPEADGPVAGRVLSLPEAGRAVALVGVDEAAALRAVVARQADEIRALRADLDAVLARLDALTASGPTAAR